VLAFAITALPVSYALASDADRNGEQLARQRCSPCHIVAAHAREESAAAPPFDVIARRADFDQDKLVNLLTRPHEKMNFALTADEAANIAAYMRTLAK
jgi:mono/diheme cytochrome c family protein